MAVWFARGVVAAKPPLAEIPGLWRLLPLLLYPMALAVAVRRIRSTSRWFPLAFALPLAHAIVGATSCLVFAVWGSRRSNPTSELFTDLCFFATLFGWLPAVPLLGVARRAIGYLLGTLYGTGLVVVLFSV
jgi:hypothetical protein